MLCLLLGEVNLHNNFVWNIPSCTYDERLACMILNVLQFTLRQQKLKRKNKNQKKQKGEVNDNKTETVVMRQPLNAVRIGTYSGSMVLSFLFPFGHSVLWFFYYMRRGGGGVVGSSSILSNF